MINTPSFLHVQIQIPLSNPLFLFYYIVIPCTNYNKLDAIFNLFFSWMKAKYINIPRKIRIAQSTCRMVFNQLVDAFKVLTF